MAAAPVTDTGTTWAADIAAAAADTQAGPWLAQIIDGTAFGAALQVFNVLIIGIATIFLTYNLFAGVASTAVDGRVFGQNRSVLWVPIRLALVPALLFPTADGYNGVQHLVRTVAGWGSAVADIAWDKAVAFVAKDGLPLANIEARLPYDVAAGLYNIHLCAITEQANQSAQNLPSALRWTIEADAEGAVTAAYYSGRGTTPCGLVRLHGGAGRSAFSSKIQDAHITAFNVLNDNMKMAANETVRFAYPGNLPWKTTTAPNISEYLSSGLRSYKSIIDNAAQDLPASKKTDAEIAAIAGSGWADAGASFLRLARANGDRAAAARYSAEIEAPGWNHPSAGFFLIRATAEPIIRTADELWRAAMLADPASSSALARGAGPARQILPLVPPTPKESSWFTDGILTKVNNAIGGLVNAAFISELDRVIKSRSTSAENPLVATISLGNDLIDAGWGAYLTSSGIAAVAGLTQGSGVAATAVISQAVSSIATPLLWGGIVLAFVIPLIPFVYYLLGTISWLVLVIEGFIASSLWLLKHLHMDGDNIHGGATHGYLLLLNILLIPSLTLAALLGTWGVYIVGFDLFDRLYWPAVDSAHPGNLGVTLTVAALLGYVVIAGLVAVVVFGLIGEAPNRILTWIGGHAQSAFRPDDAGNRIYAGMHSSTGAAAAAAAGGISAAAARQPRAPGGGQPRGAGRGHGHVQGKAEVGALTPGIAPGNQ